MLTLLIATTIFLSWILSFTSFHLWRRMVYREISLLGLSAGYLSLALAFVVQLLLVVNPVRGIFPLLNHFFLLVGVGLIFWSIIRLLTKKKFFRIELPWMLVIIGVMPLVIGHIFTTDRAIVAAIFSWFVIVPMSLTLAILFLLGYSQSVLLDTFRRSRGALFMSLSWFVFGLVQVTLRWVYGQPEMAFYYLGTVASLAFMMVSFTLLIRRSQPLDGHHKRVPEKHIYLGDEEWQVRFL